MGLPPTYKPKPKECVLSASSLGAFRQCPVKFRLQYREFLRPAEDADALRYGSNFHACFESVSQATDEEVVDFIAKRYENVPASKSHEDWETERNTLISLFLGYRHQWHNDPVEIEETERPFKIEIAPGLVIQGKIDAIGVWQGRRVIVERKTTSSALDAYEYWGRLRNDVQVSIYVLYMAEMGERMPTLYDVTRKPTIRRKQKETPEEFGQRLAGDIVERPEHYYARREVPRTDKDIANFRVQLIRMADAVRSYDEKGCWWSDFGRCDDPYPCPYKGICHGSGSDVVVSEKLTPPGFVRLTVHGK